MRTFSGQWRDGSVARSPSPRLARSLRAVRIGVALGSLSGAAIASGQERATTALAAPRATATAPSISGASLPVADSAEDRTYGPTRPGLGTPANTMGPGQISVETALIDWQRDDQDGTRSDTVLYGSTTIRIGVTRNVEAMVGWTPVGHVRVRDATGAVDRADRVGDAVLGFKANLLHPDGSGLSAAVQPFVVLPVGRMPVGVGDWGGGIVAPVSYDVSRTVNIAVTGEIDAATNSSGTGRHASFSIVGGVGLALTPTIKVTGELAMQRDNDPAEQLTQSFASISVGWSARGDLQFDMGSAVGLNRDSPDMRLYGGISRRF